MPTCIQCRKAEAQETVWEKIAHWLIWRFPEAVKSERVSASLHSFEDGYRIGVKQQKELHETKTVQPAQ